MTTACVLVSALDNPEERRTEVTGEVFAALLALIAAGIQPAGKEAGLPAAQVPSAAPDPPGRTSKGALREEAVTNGAPGGRNPGPAVCGKFAWRASPGAVSRTNEKPGGAPAKTGALENTPPAAGSAPEISGTATLQSVKDDFRKGGDKTNLYGREAGRALVVVAASGAQQSEVIPLERPQGTEKAKEGPAKNEKAGKDTTQVQGAVDSGELEGSPAVGIKERPAQDTPAVKTLPAIKALSENKLQEVSETEIQRSLGIREQSLSAVVENATSDVKEAPAQAQSAPDTRVAGRIQDTAKADTMLADALKGGFAGEVSDQEENGEKLKSEKMPDLPGASVQATAGPREEKIKLEGAAPASLPVAETKPTARLAVSVDPPGLGKIEVVAALKGGSLSVQLAAVNPATVGLLAGVVPAVAASLNREYGRVQVTVRGNPPAETKPIKKAVYC